jgi:hypothetical protein
MFFWQRKYNWKTRVIKIRDDWGKLQKVEINLGEPIRTDLDLQEQLETTVIIRRLE